MVDLRPYSAGIQAAMNDAPFIQGGDPRGAFLNVLTSEGLHEKSVILGRIVRVKGIDDKGAKKSAWYIYNEIETEGGVIGVGAYGDWKINLSKNWVSTSEHKLDSKQRTQYHAQRAAMQAQREIDERERHNEAADRAFKIWSAANDADDTHPYLVTKGVKAAQGIKISKDGDLIIPRAIDTEIVSLQFVRGDGEFIINGNPIGNKKFLFGGRNKGAWFKIEGDNDNVYISEGYSTAYSVYEATGCTTYCAFNAGNLYEVTSYARKKHPAARIIIAGDDDINTTNNAGRTKAEQAAQGLGVECIFPAGFIDFNDMHQAQGIDTLRQYLSPDKIEVYEHIKPRVADEVYSPNGVLDDIANYYHATSGNNQVGFAVQTALALCSILLGRSFKTSLENYTSLYFLNVAKSGTGKEHAKTIIEKIMLQTNYAHLIAGDGYTSAGAVFSTLLDRPKHISVIDEFGRYLEAGRNLAKGNAHQREANTKLMESIGRAHSVIRPPSYSTMTLKKDAAKELKNRLVHNPAITLLTMTTPDTLFSTLDMGAIKDGFINRFIISISSAERAKRRHKPPIDVPDSIINWVNAIMERGDMTHIAAEPAEPIVLDFTSEALALQDEFQDYCIDKANALEKYGMSELSGRSNELAMRVSLIAALSRDPHTVEINKDDMIWSIAYIKNCLETTIDKLKISISHSDFEHHKKEVLADMRRRANNGITWAQMQKTPPYSQHKQRDLKEILQALRDANLAGEEPHKPNGGGRPSVKWKALK